MDNKHYQHAQIIQDVGRKKEKAHHDLGDKGGVINIPAHFHLVSGCLTDVRVKLNSVVGANDTLFQISSFREEMKAQESRTFTAIETEELAHVRYEDDSHPKSKRSSLSKG